MPQRLTRGPDPPSKFSVLNILRSKIFEINILLGLPTIGGRVSPEAARFYGSDLDFFLLQIDPQTRAKQAPGSALAKLYSKKIPVQA
jgi:hypothetical protein